MDAPPPEPDSRNSLRHILATDPSMDDPKPEPPSQANTPGPDDGDAAAQAQSQSQSQSQDGSRTATDPEATPHYTATTTTVRRNANGSVSSVYSGNKIKHLKKDDGIPLWRKDIQYDFLKLVFEDDTRAFTKQSDKTGGHTFADIYLDAMAKSSKCSKILKDKLLTERPAAINMAMVCLLVNVGRMNTTLNCMLQPPSLFCFVPSNRDQSSLRCERNCEPTTRSPPSKPTRTPTPTSNCRMLHA
jgi:Ino eighty subunit 1